MKIGIYPGSFDPIHLGHIKIVNKILEDKIVDKVLIVPTGDYWDKNVNADLKDRISMAKFFESDKIIVEEKDNNIKATYDFLEAKKKEYKGDEFWLIIGGDNLENIHRWINYVKLIEYPFIVVKRDGFDESYIDKRFNDMSKRNYKVLDIPNIEISSTYIRENIDNKEALNEIMDSRVLEYIQNNSLYQ